MFDSKFLIIVLFVVSSILSCKTTTDSEPNNVSNSDAKEIVLKPQTATFKINGMMCPDGCAKLIEKKLRETRGIQKVVIDFEAKSATVNFDLDKLTSQDIVKKVEAIGDGETYKVNELKQL